MIYVLCLSHLTGDLSHSEVIYCLSGAGRDHSPRVCGDGAWCHCCLFKSPGANLSGSQRSSDFYRAEMKLFRDASQRWSSVPGFSSQYGVLLLTPSAGCTDKETGVTPDWIRIAEVLERIHDPLENVWNIWSNTGRTNHIKFILDEHENHVFNYLTPAYKTLVRILFVISKSTVMTTFV